MTFFQTFVVAFGLLLSFNNFAVAECPVIDIHGYNFELYQDAIDYADDLSQLKADLIELNEDVHKETAGLPTNDDNLNFLKGDCKSLTLFAKTTWYNNGDLRFLDFAKRIIAVQEARMRLLLDTGYVREAMDSADMVLEIEELFEIKGSFAGLFFFLVIAFILRKIQEADFQEKDLRKYELTDRMQCGITRVTFNHRANRLFVKKGKLAVLCILVTLLGSLLHTTGNAAPLDNFKSSKILKGDCKKQRFFLLETTRIFKDVMEANFAKDKIAKAEKSLLTCLRDTFKAKLAEKINSLTKKQRTIKNYDGNGTDLVVKKSSLNKLRSLARFYNEGTISFMSEEMKDAALMSLSYFKKEEVITIVMKKVWSRSR